MGQFTFLEKKKNPNKASADDKKIEVIILLSIHLLQEDYFPKSFAYFLERFVQLPAEIAAVVDRM